MIVLVFVLILAVLLAIHAGQRSDQERNTRAAQGPLSFWDRRVPAIIWMPLFVLLFVSVPFSCALVTLTGLSPS